MMDNRNPIKTRTAEPIIRLQPSFSECFSPSRDQRSVPNNVSPNFNTEGDDDKGNDYPSKNPSPPSKNRIRTSVGLAIDPNPNNIPRESPPAIRKAARKGVPT